jgi:AraC-like DNA-binding protein
VVMLTAKVSIEDKLAGLETGADDYILKPFDMKELLVRCMNLINQRRRLREKFSRSILGEPGEFKVTSIDEQFLKHAISIAEDHIDDEFFNLDSFCMELNMSRSTLFRKLLALTNQSPVEFIRTIRLKRGASLLKQNFGTIAEIALEVGFSNPSYFAKCFRKAFGVSPKKYISV